MKRILLLGSQHGNERLGDALYAHLTTKRLELLPYITFTIGNIEAHAKNLRFIESDLNRSYNGNNATLEEKRATELLGYIRTGNFDLVLDLHTTTCQQPPCIIYGKTSAQTNHFMKATAIEHIIHMNHDIVKSSLIGVYDRAISIEVHRKSINDELLDALCDDIERYILEKSFFKHPREYEVFDLLTKDELTKDEIMMLRNFEKSNQGFYPVLVGENSYKKQTSYLGFKARLLRKGRV